MATLKGRLAAGETLIGPFVILDSPDLIEILGRAGWDFVIIDCEHGPFGNETVGNLVRACQVVGLHSIVRVPANEEWLINKALDVGAQAVLVPQIDSIEAARKAASAAKYAPRGHRGANPFTRAADFGARPGREYYGAANDDTMMIVLIEGASGAAAFHEIAKLENVDAFFIGPIDLSHSLGVPGQPDHPRVIEKVREMVSLARESGKAVGVFANHDVERARAWAQAGVQLVTFGVDTTIVFRAFQGLAEDLKHNR